MTSRESHLDLRDNARKEPRKTSSYGVLNPTTMLPRQPTPSRSASASLSEGPDSAEEPQLRHVEKDVLIPKMMREKARDLCSDKVEVFTKCCQDAGILMVVKCREENKGLKQCLTGYYTDAAFYEECKAEYLKQREDFRATGIRPGQKQQKLPTSM